MKVAIIGSGGRESALAWKFAQSLGERNVIMASERGPTDPTNAGTRDADRRNAGPECRPDAPSLLPHPAAGALAGWCKDQGVDLVIPGSEAVLMGTLGEDLATLGGPPLVGPARSAARLEGSKAWAKEFMRRYGVATGRADLAESVAEARRLLLRWDGPVVVKYDGLAAGKGVFVARDREEAWSGLERIEAQWGSGARVVLEESLEGDEVSLIGFTDGETIRMLPPAQDHKQLEDGDRGPNTGGMGAFAPVKWCEEEAMAAILREVVHPTLRGIRREGLRYVGPIFFGLMVTRNGPRLLEYNVRFGGPETQVLMPLLENDLTECYQACREGTLDRVELRFRPGFSVGVVLAAPTYPERGSQGLPITGLDRVPGDVLVFESGMRRAATGVVTDGGRILTVVGQGPTLEAARQRAAAGVEAIDFPGKRWRRDIGCRPRKSENLENSGTQDFFPGEKVLRPRIPQ